MINFLKMDSGGGGAIASTPPRPYVHGFDFIPKSNLCGVDLGVCCSITNGDGSKQLTF
jgi:hypothetical protein